MRFSKVSLRSLLVLAIALVDFRSTLVFGQDPLKCPVILNDPTGKVTSVPVTQGSYQETCSYKITVAENSKVEATFSKVELGKTHNLVYVFNGPSCHAEGWNKVPAGSKDTVTTDKNQLTVFTRFTENEANQVEFSYDTVAGNDQLPFHQKCGRELVADVGEIDTKTDLTEPGAPCVFKLKSASNGKITMSIARFDITDTFNELWVYDGPDCSSPMILYVNKDKYKADMEIKSTGSELTVLSLAEKTQSPFDITYSAEIPPTTAPPITTKPAPPPITTKPVPPPITTKPIPPPITTKPFPPPITTKPVETTTTGHATTIKASTVGFLLMTILPHFY